jgi:hypothetical protein
MHTHTNINPITQEAFLDNVTAERKSSPNMIMGNRNTMSDLMDKLEA